MHEINLISNKHNFISFYIQSLLISMSCFNIQIKPHKSWKTLSTGLRSKFRKLKNSTNHIVLATTRRLTSHKHRHSSLRTYRELESNRFMTLYIDQLYAAAQQSAQRSEIIKPKEAPLARQKVVTSSTSSSSSSTLVQRHEQGLDSVKVKYETVDDAWKAIVAKSPLLRVDERAEEFIKKFRKDMMLQKEKSLIDYYEMVTKGG